MLVFRMDTALLFVMTIFIMTEPCCRRNLMSWAFAPPPPHRSFTPPPTPVCEAELQVFFFFFCLLLFIGFQSIQLTVMLSVAVVVSR